MWARIGSLFILSKHLGNASQVWVVGVVRARGGVGTMGLMNRHATSCPLGTEAFRVYDLTCSEILFMQACKRPRKRMSSTD